MSEPHDTRYDVHEDDSTDESEGPSADPGSTLVQVSGIKRRGRPPANGKSWSSDIIKHALRFRREAIKPFYTKHGSEWRDHIPKNSWDNIRRRLVAKFGADAIDFDVQTLASRVSAIIYQTRNAKAYTTSEPVKYCRRYLGKYEDCAGPVADDVSTEADAEETAEEHELEEAARTASANALAVVPAVATTTATASSSSTASSTASPVKSPNRLPITKEAVKEMAKDAFTPVTQSLSVLETAFKGLDAAYGRQMQVFMVEMKAHMDTQFARAMEEMNQRIEKRLDKMEQHLQQRLQAVRKEDDDAMFAKWLNYAALQPRVGIMAPPTMQPLPTPASPKFNFQIL